MRIFYVNNDGGGFADFLNVEEGVTVGRLFASKLPDRNPDDYLIRVNRQIAAADEVLHEGDRVSFTPNKIEGARTQFSAVA